MCLDEELNKLKESIQNSENYLNVFKAKFNQVTNQYFYL